MPIKPGLSLPEGELILPMKQADLDRVYQLECASQTHPWSRQHFLDELNKPVASIDLYWANDALAGFLCSWLIAGELQIQNLATRPGFRRRGIAQSLMQHVIDRGKSSGLTSVWLEVRVSNSAAIALYEKFGFEKSGMRQAYYPDGEDAVLMTLKAGTGC